MNKFIFSVLLALALIVPVGAQVPTPCGTAGAPPCPITSAQGVLDLMTKIFGFFFGVVVVLASIFLLYAAFEYVTSRGDEGKIDKAKTIIIYAIAALVVAAVAYGVPAIVKNFVG